jgi:serine/threonine-protein kinase RsbW
MIRKYPASLDKLYEMLQFVREQASLAAFDEKQVSKIELALEEALVNIISYGYPNRNGTIEIDCKEPNSTGLTIIVKDRGIPYNPLTNAKPFDPTTPLEERTIGGYGIYFILKIMDEVEYRRENNYNILTLIKYRV